MNDDDSTIIGHEQSLGTYHAMLAGQPLRLCTDPRCVLHDNDPDVIANAVAKARLALRPKDPANGDTAETLTTED